VFEMAIPMHVNELGIKGRKIRNNAPPFSFLRTIMDGGFLFRRIPKPSSSFSMSFLSWSGFNTSRTWQK